jgi:hypothetical protein
MSFRSLYSIALTAFILIWGSLAFGAHRRAES